MNIPNAIDYLAAAGPFLQELQEKIANTCLAEIRGAVNYLDVSRRAQAIATAMRTVGYDMRLLDEDGEAMISHGAALPEAGAITVQAHWDDEAGASVVCTFKHGDERVVFAGPDIAGTMQVVDG